MSATYTIATVQDRTRDWQTTNGEFRSYYLTVEGDDKTYELAQKRKTDPPKVGDSFEANVETREHEGTTYYQLKRVYQQGNRNGGRSYGHSPEERQSIERQVAAKCASDLLVGFMASGWKPDTALKLGELHTVLARSIAAEIKG